MKTQEWLNRCHFGDCLETLRGMPDGIVNTCVTSPPYFGLRDYGHAGQIGLEPTPDEFVAKLVTVFREVRRVLRDDGTLWLNIGDSYNAKPGHRKDSDEAGEKQRSMRGSTAAPSRSWEGCKPKDLIGIPWMLAFALRQPYYVGRIKKPMDRVWLAAMIDAEGCFFIHKRKAGASSGAKFTRADGTEVTYSRVNDTYGPGVEVCNTHRAIVERCLELTGMGSICTQDGGRKQTLYRWTVRGDEARMVAREVYPYLVGKMQQARIASGCPTSGPLAEAAHEALKGLHHGAVTDVDFAPPQSATEPGWYLRQEVIWSKPNPMPESVTDRCTKSHEQIFLMAKSASYYFDAEAMKEPSVTNDPRRPYTSKGAKDLDGRSEWKSGQARDKGDFSLRNKRSVWTVTTKPFKGAHFATFPPDLIEPCVLAGAPAGGIVLDPFFGSGTTGQVAQALGRQFIGIELNEEYKPLQDERLRQPSLLLEAA